MTDFAPGDRVYNRRPFFGAFMPPKRKEPARRGTVRTCARDDGWPWIRWDDGYECAVSPEKLRPLSAVDELAALAGD